MSVFVDVVIVEVKVGCGGNGKVVFCREVYVEFGGFVGGNGGCGGYIYFIGDEGKNMLIDLKYNRYIKVVNGVYGGFKGMYGVYVEDIYVCVLLGMICYDDKENLIGEVLEYG